MKILLFTFIIVMILLNLAPQILLGDLSLIDINAICRVYYKDGKVLEGVISVARGGDQLRYYDTDGFYILLGNSKLTVLFDPYFVAFEPWNGVLNQNEKGVAHWGPSYKNPTVYYLRDITSQKRAGGLYKLNEDFDSIAGKLRREFKYQMEFELLTYIPVFAEVPKELYLKRDSLSIQATRVRIDEIDKFEFVLIPSEKWLASIAEAEKTWLAENVDETGDYYLPLWFHDIVKRKEDFRGLFKPWNL